MEFTPQQRALLINQFEILKAIEPERAKDHDEKIEILANGYSIFYDDVIWVSDDMPEDDCRFVLDVLSMYRSLEAFFRDNPDSPALSEYYSRYRGFDGNDETNLYGFARFLIETQGKFQEQRDNPEFEFNSHSHVAGQYQRMVAAWERADKKYQLTADEVDAIVGA